MKLSECHGGMIVYCRLPFRQGLVGMVKGVRHNYVGEVVLVVEFADGEERLIHPGIVERYED